MPGKKHLISFYQVVVKDLVGVCGRVFIKGFSIVGLTELIAAENELYHPGESRKKCGPRVERTHRLKMGAVDLVGKWITQALENQGNFFLKFSRIHVVWIQLKIEEAKDVLEIFRTRSLQGPGRHGMRIARLSQKGNQGADGMILPLFLSNRTRLLKYMHIHIHGLMIWNI